MSLIRQYNETRATYGDLLEKQERLEAKAADCETKEELAVVEQDIEDLAPILEAARQIAQKAKAEYNIDRIQRGRGPV